MEANGTVFYKEFWDLVEPSNHLRVAILKSETVIADDHELTVTFNDHYVNIAEKSSGKKPISLTKDTGISDDYQIVLLILDKY